MKNPAQLLALLPLAVALNAHAENIDFSMGAAGSYANGIYKGTSGNWTAAPVLQLESKHFYVRGLSAGMKLFESEDQSQELLLGASYLLNYQFDPKKTRDARLKRLNKRRASITADISYNLYTPYGNLETSLQHDVSGKSHGSRFSAQYSYFWEATPRLTDIPAIGFVHSSKRFNQYYYGISAAESTRSGLNAFDARASLQPYAEVQVEYEINKQFSLIGSLYSEGLAKRTRRSAMLEGRHIIEGSVGVLYHF